MVGRREGFRSDYLTGYNLIILRALTFEHCQDPYALPHVLAVCALIEFHLNPMFINTLSICSEVTSSAINWIS